MKAWYAPRATLCGNARMVEQALLRILKRIIQRGQQLTTTNFFAVMSQLAAEAKHEEWPLQLEDTIRVLRKELMVPYTQCVEGNRSPSLCVPWR